jgi:saccharopine dehydrogenase (NADP+, L-glutamate forming)/spermidine synthase
MASGKTVLILGAGMSCPPLPKYLDQHGYNVIVANRTLSKAQHIVDQCSKSARAVELDIEKPEGVALLEQLTPQVDAVVSMLPYLFHPVAARIAIHHKKHFFTTSYVSDTMRGFDQAAKDAGVILINECGIDPGCDHASAMRVMDAVRAKGGKITSFTSYCGGLPATECNDNPFGYKLSWAPRGVLLASRNDARFLRGGQEVFIPGKDLFDNFELDKIEGLGEFERYPNRNSCTYIDVYGLRETVQTMMRGTYRNKGWCPTIKKLADVGYLNIDDTDLSQYTYKELTAHLVGADKAAPPADVRRAIASKVNIKPEDPILDRIEWIGLLSGRKVTARSNLDALCDLFKERLVYKPGERDMLLMRHEFVAEYPDRTEHLSSTLIDYGIPNGDTSMMRTVSYPVAIAVRLVLEGRIRLTGIQIPVIPELYNPILDELETLGIKFVDKADRVVPK